MAKVKKAPAVEWEIKDRVYYLKGNKKPLVMTLPSKHSEKRSLLYFDEEKGYQRELRYATNQPSVFADEQEGPVTLAHVMFRDGSLYVPRENQALQKLLSLYHPLRNRMYEEFDAVKEAVDDLEYIQFELEALNLAAAMDIDQAEAIMRVEYGSKVSEMTSKEIKRDIILFAKRNPSLMLELANDENVELRSTGVKAVEAGILKLANDQRTFTWASNGRKVMTVPFDENPYSALAAYFKTDEGIEVYQNIEKRLK
tara:strand:+ start:9507 stop:10271 length:765 start_codon:yes stop_codon:yes gene_type:complete